MLEFLFYILLIYLAYKSLQFFIRYINSGSNSNVRSRRKEGESSKSKFDDVEEAEFKEIKDEDKKNSKD